MHDMEKIKGKELRIAAVVTEVEHKETKTGKPFCILHLEDYHSSYNLYLFGDDYINLKAYLTVGWLLFLSGKVRKKFYNDDLEFKVSSVDLLSEVIDKDVRDVILRIDVKDISKDFVEDMVSITKKNSGKHSMLLSLVDPLSGYEVEVLSRKVKINLSKDFVNQINSLSNVRMKVK